MIRYKIPDAGYVRMVIYNMMGQAVRRLVEKNQHAGYQQAVWDGRDDRMNALGSGMHLVRMEARKFSAMRKVVLMK
jgi:flagellar hook assembly protein FlgD